MFFRRQTDCILDLRYAVFGLLFFDGSLSRNYLRIYLESDIEYRARGSTKLSPRTRVFFGISSTYFVSKSTVRTFTFKFLNKADIFGSTIS